MRFVLLISTLLIASSAARQDAPSGAGVVRGRITAAEGEPVGEIVVYLEPMDSSKTFPAPKDVPSLSQKGAKFEPSLLVICVGQTVEFKNDEDRPIEHNVFSRSEAKEFDLGVYKPGNSKSVTFDQCGPVKLFCSIHRYMDGAIYVCPTPFFVIADADGAFRIEGVPAGEYHVKTWQRKQRYDEADQAVRVADGAEAAADITLKR